MAKRPLPTPEELRQLLRYEAETGKLFWRTRTASMFRATKPKLHGTGSAEWACNTWNARNAEREITHRYLGYITLLIDRRPFLAHRVIWAMAHDQWPEGHIDHINGIRDDNRLSNLRDVPPADNQRNQGISRANRSGVTGVSWVQHKRRWVARVQYCGVVYYAGQFKNLQDAEVAVRAKRAALGFSPNHGSVRPDYSPLATGTRLARQGKAEGGEG